MTTTPLLNFPAILLLFASAARAETVVEQWVTRYNGTGNGTDAPEAIAVDSAGDVIVTGSSTGSGSNRDYYTAKYARLTGALLWEKRYNGPYNGSDRAHALVVDGANNVIVTGESPGSNGTRDYYTAKYAGTNGTLIWEKRYDGPWVYSSDIANGLAVDNVGNVVVTGQSQSDSYSDYYTVKYAAADGAVIWEKRYDGPSGTYDYAKAVVVDGAGNVIVTGDSDSSVQSPDYYTAKYAAADGALLWEMRYAGPVQSDYAVALALDVASNVVVTGFSEDANGYFDYYTVKYSAASGAIVWDQRYNGPANSDDRATSVAVDSTGNVIVTGQSTGGSGIGYDCYTAKYASANGMLVWERRYNGNNNQDFGNAVKVDTSGNVIVAGYSKNGSVDGSENYYTAKYAAANGAVLWEAAYDGGGSKSDFIYGNKQIALSPGGVVVITGTSSNGTNSDYATVKYVPTADGDNDGLPDPWELGHFGTTLGHGAIGDTDGDGRPELSEMAFGTDPLVPNAGTTPAIVIEGGYLTTTIIRKPGIIYRVLTAASPDAPSFSEATTTVLLDNGTTLKVRDNFPIGALGSRFMRVKVTAAP